MALAARRPKIAAPEMTRSPSNNIGSVLIAEADALSPCGRQEVARWSRPHGAVGLSKSVVPRCATEASGHEGKCGDPVDVGTAEQSLDALLLVRPPVPALPTSTRNFAGTNKGI